MIIKDCCMYTSFLIAGLSAATLAQASFKEECKQEI